MSEANHEITDARITCPCCGYKTIGEEFDICCICSWEHDEVMEQWADERGGANTVSLREAQNNFAKFGARTEDRSRFGRKPTPRDVRDPNWKPLGPETKPAKVRITVPVNCSCCGYKTVLGAFNTCEICFWPHDPQQDTKRDEARKENGLSLREAQRNFVKFGAAWEALGEYTRKPTAQEEKDPGWKPFD